MYKRQVIPGDRLDIVSSLAADRSMMVKFDCEASVDGDLACSASLTIVEQEISLESVT